MTENDERVLRDIIIGGNGYDYDESILQSIFEEIKQYKTIGTIEEFKALKEKAEPKKPICNDLCTCPSCSTHNEVIKKRRNTVVHDTVYCWHCGQAIECQRDIDLD